MLCRDLFTINEQKLKDMNVKFGHRNKIIDILKKINILESFLDELGLSAHKKDLEDLGFNSIFSIFGVKPEFAERMKLSKEEMEKWTQKIASMVMNV